MKCNKGEQGKMEKRRRLIEARIQESEYSGFWILYSEFFSILPYLPHLLSYTFRWVKCYEYYTGGRKDVKVSLFRNYRDADQSDVV